MAPSADPVLVSMDGRLCEPADAVVSVLDRGFLFGDSVYEAVRTYAGRIFALPDHLARLRRSAAALSLDIPWSDDDFEAHLGALVDAAGERMPDRDFSVRFIVTRGSGPVDLDPSGARDPRTVMIAQPLPEGPDPRVQSGVSLIIAGVRRNPRESLDPNVKSGNYLNSVQAKAEAAAAGADDALMLNRDGLLTEGTNFNLFAVLDGVLVTPPVSAGLLEGITRRRLLDIAAEAGIPAREDDLRPDDLERADEVLISSTTREVLPVREVDGRTLPGWTGGPGPVGDDLRRRYRRLVRAELGLPDTGGETGPNRPDPA